MGPKTGKSQAIVIRRAMAEDVDGIRRLVLEQGATRWNWFPRKDLEQHLSNIATGTDQALLAFNGGMLVGMVSFKTGSFYTEYEPVTSSPELTGYIVEALVHSSFGRQGIGTRLLECAKALLAKYGVSRIYAKRDEENRASEALLRKTGFQVIDRFSDPRRVHGSHRTAIERCNVKS